MATKKRTAVPAARRGSEGPDRIEARRRFVRRASHDLRQPLAALKLLLFDLRRSLDDPRHKHLIQVMTSSVAMMQRFVGNLIEYESLTAGLSGPDPEPVLVDELFCDLKDRLAEDERIKASTLRIAPSHRAVMADRRLLDLCLGHIAENAFTHGAAGRKVLLGARPAAGAVRIEVWDQGPGIAETERAEIFQPYRRASSPGADGGSLGLGLAIADACARQMGTRIEVCSLEGRGSRFSITLPATAPPALPAEVPVVEQASAFVGIDVLIAGHKGTDWDHAGSLLDKWGAHTWDGTLTKSLTSLAGRQIEPALAVLCGPLPKGVEPSGFAQTFAGAFRKQPPTIFVCEQRPPPDVLGDAWFLPTPLKPAALRSLATHLLHLGNDRGQPTPPAADPP